MCTYKRMNAMLLFSLLRSFAHVVLYILYIYVHTKSTLKIEGDKRQKNVWKTSIKINSESTTQRLHLLMIRKLYFQKIQNNSQYKIYQT